MRRLLTALLVLPLCVSVLTSCAEEDPTVVALLIADGSTELGQTVDRVAFEERVAATCVGCELAVYDAGGEADTQDGQVDEALAASADVVVVDPVDPEAAEEVVARLGEVPMVAYATLVPGADSFVGLESDEALVDATQGGATSDLDAARDIVAGDRRTMTYVPARAMSERAADVAVGVVAEEPVPGAVDHEGVPSWLFQAADVDIDTLTSVLVAQQAVTLDELCDGETAKRCAKLGLR
jgi:ABC-type xylose transport system substrate-binding protein